MAKTGGGVHLKKFKISGHKFHENHQMYSRHREFCANPPLLTNLLEASARQVVIRAGRQTELDGIIPGHLKLLVKAGDSGFALSMTRPNEVEATFLGGWQALEQVTEYAVTVNFILLTPTPFAEADVIDALSPEAVR